MSSSRRETAQIAAALLVLLALWGANVAGWPQGRVGDWRHELVTTMSNRGLNKEAREALTAGYYEGLLNEGSRLSTMNRFVIDGRRPGWEDNSRPDRQQTHDFLYYEHIPSLKIRDYEDDRFKYWLTTNSAGLGDKEYPLVKPADTRRIALIGDSITRGLGAPDGGNYESLLEARLNHEWTNETVRHFEILNFAVGGYHITQLLESAKVKAPPYAPDAYVVALSDLSVYRRWHGHIATLMYSGIDLKYDYLKNMIREARLTADDPIGVFDARLARYRIPTIKWVLEELREQTRAAGVPLMIVLVPTTEDPKELAEAFLGVREVVEDLGIPLIDLVDTFAGQDLVRYRVSEGDRHPNAAGHQRLFERLYAQLEADPRKVSVLTGGAREGTR